MPLAYRFTGQRKEHATKLYHYGARWYDPTLGRFIQPDTIVPDPADPQSLNRYAYVNNNPVRYSDPSGHAACIDVRCDLIQTPTSSRPTLRGVIPPPIRYIYKEMVRNAQSSLVKAMQLANAVSRFGGFNTLLGKAAAYSIWASQVMDARIKKYAGPLAPAFGNWDHKPILYPRDPQQSSPVPEIVEREGWSTVGSALYRFDIWSNIDYGYVGRASGFSQPELTGGAGIEQIGSDLYSYPHTHRWPSQSSGADNWAASWDDPSDNAAIQIGIHLWNQYGLSVRPSDIYLAVLEEPRLATQPLGGIP